MAKFRSKTFANSAMYALNGIRLAYKTQRNFRKHILITIFCLSLALIFKVDVISFCIILITNFLVLIMEIINSVVEFLTDAYYKNKWAKLAKMSKDMAAGAVLLMSIVSASITAILILNKIYLIYLKI